MKDRSLFRGVLITLLLYVAMFALLSFALSTVDTRSKSAETEALKAAVLRATLTCYAVEGRYPANAAYLSDYYGLVYDAQRYIISFSAFADNLLPDISVLIRGEV